MNVTPSDFYLYERLELKEYVSTSFDLLSRSDHANLYAGQANYSAEILNGCQGSTPSHLAKALVYCRALDQFIFCSIFLLFLIPSFFLFDVGTLL